MEHQALDGKLVELAEKGFRGWGLLLFDGRHPTKLNHIQAARKNLGFFGNSLPEEGSLDWVFHSGSRIVISGSQCLSFHRSC